MSERLKKFVCDKAFMKAVLVVAVPLMLQQLISSSVNLVDNLMVGQLGDTAIGSVAAVNRYYIIALYGTNGLAAAASVFVAQYYGAKQEQKMKESFRCMLLFAGIIMILFSACGLLFSSSILGFFTTDQAIIASGVKYISVAAWSFFPTAVTTCIYNAMRAVGETKIPLRCSVVAVATNTLLNYCLIFGNFGFPVMGVTGAAIATLISRLLELLLALTAVGRSDFAFKTRIQDIFKIPADVVKKVLMKAAPLMLNEILWSFGMAMLFKFYSFRGSDVMSGYSIASTIGDIFFTLFGGMAAATTVFISQPLGADKLEEAKANAYKLMGFSFLLALFFAAGMLASSTIVPYLYSEISDNAKTIAETFLKVQSLMFWIYMATTQCYFTLRAGGDMKHTLIMDSCFMWAVNIPLVACVTYLTDLPYIAVYLTGQMTDIVKLIFSYHLFSKGEWIVNLTGMDQIESDGSSSLKS